MLLIILKVLVNVINYQFFYQLNASGYRYELYCGSKANKNTQCTIHTEINREEAWKFNENRSKENEKYTRETFDALVMRYEEPDGKNRWDSPLFTIFPHQELDKNAVMSCLFDEAPPPPNMSTQNVLNSINFVRIFIIICCSQL